MSSDSETNTSSGSDPFAAFGTLGLSTGALAEIGRTQSDLSGLAGLSVVASSDEFNKIGLSSAALAKKVTESIGCAGLSAIASSDSVGSDAVAKAALGSSGVGALSAMSSFDEFRKIGLSSAPLAKTAIEPTRCAGLSAMVSSEQFSKIGLSSATLAKTIMGSSGVAGLSAVTSSDEFNKIGLGSAALATTTIGSSGLGPFATMDPTVASKLSSTLLSASEVLTQYPNLTSTIPDIVGKTIHERPDYTPTPPAHPTVEYPEPPAESSLALEIGQEIRQIVISSLWAANKISDHEYKLTKNDKIRITVALSLMMIAISNRWPIPLASDTVNQFTNAYTMISVVLSIFSRDR